MQSPFCVVLRCSHAACSGGAKQCTQNISFSFSLHFFFAQSNSGEEGKNKPAFTVTYYCIEYV